MQYQHPKAPRGGYIKKTAPLLLALFSLLSLAAETVAMSGGFTVTETDGRISVVAIDAPLKAVIDAIREKVQIDVDGEISEDDRVSANFENLPLEQAVSKLTNRYVFVHDETDGRVIRIVLFQQGADAPAPAERASSRSLNAQALDAWKHGDIRSAIDYFEAAVALDPDDWVPHADYGRLLVVMTSYQAAGPHLERAAELDSGNPRVWLDLYSYYQRTLQLERALKAREQADTLADGQAIVQDRTGLWRLEGGSIYPDS